MKQNTIGNYDYDYKEFATNREKARSFAGRYNFCYDCEGRIKPGCVSCNYDKEFGKNLKSRKDKIKYSI